MFFPIAEDSGESPSESDNSVSDSIDENDDSESVAEISRSFRSRQELCEQLNVNHMIQRIFLITLDNSECLTPTGYETCLFTDCEWFELKTYSFLYDHKYTLQFKVRKIFLNVLMLLKVALIWSEYS